MNSRFSTSVDVFTFINFFLSIADTSVSTFNSFLPTAGLYTPANPSTYAGLAFFLSASFLLFVI